MVACRCLDLEEDFARKTKHASSITPEHDVAMCPRRIGGDQELNLTAIFKLPQELVLLIIEKLVLSMRARNSLQLRLVNSKYELSVMLP